MPRFDYANCRGCGGTRAQVGQLSHTRLCRSCAIDAVGSNLEGLQDKSGPALLAWRRAVAAGVGAVLVDDLTAATQNGST